MYSFRKVFAPTKDEQIEMIEKYIYLHKKNINHCSTCTFYNGDVIASVVEYPGKCMADSAVFFQKEFCAYAVDCPFYTHNDAELMNLVSKLKKLKGCGI